MSKFRILRIDNYNPVTIGKKNRLLFVVYGIIPTLFLLTFNPGLFGNSHFLLRILIAIPVLGLSYFLLLKKMRSTINNIKTIGELEITQSCLRKRIGDSMTEYSFKMIKEIRLTKHIPATRLRESKNKYFSYILKIVLLNRPEESMVVSDRSVDHDNKISVADTIKTLKKLVPFEVIIEI
jgi:hypothetical protein